MSRVQSPRGFHQDDQGIVLVFVLVLMSVLLGMLALVVDVGNARQQRRQAQTAADASALAGAEVLEAFGPGFVGSPGQWTTVVDQVKGYAQQNWDVQPADWNGCTDSAHLAYTPDGSNTCISADFALWSAPLPGDPVNTVNRLRVRLPQRSISSIFGSVLGIDSLSTGATATASVTRTTHTITNSVDVTTPGGPCALCILADTGHTLDGQNGDVTITGGGVTVNSVSTPAASLHSNGHVKITLPCTTVDGEQVCNTIGGPAADQVGNFTGSGFSPSPTVKDRVEDPLANVPQCGDGGLGDGTTTTIPAECPSTLITTAAKSLPSTLSPGIYEHGIEGSHTLQPGVYVLKGDITLKGNDLITGSGVTLYMACSTYPNPCATNAVGAGIKATGNGALTLSAPTTGTFKGLTIFADRGNAATQTFRGNGTNESGPTSGSSGTIYLKNGTLDLRGNGYTLASMIIVNRFEMDGNPSAVTIAYDLDKNDYVETHHTETSTTTSYSYDATGLVD
jgi:hypothetical protein